MLRIFSGLMFYFLMVLDGQSQNSSCNTIYLGEYLFTQRADCYHSLIIGSSLCLKNNIIITDQNVDGENDVFRYNDTLYFYNCATSKDSLFWLYFFINKNLLTNDRFLTSVPYSTFHKKREVFHYHCKFELASKWWEAEVNIRNNIMIELVVWNKIEGAPVLNEFGACKLIEK